MQVKYYLTDDNCGGRYHDTICQIIEDGKARKICEIGGGASPLLPLSFIQEHNLDYTILDISPEELAKAPDGYKKVVADISSPDFNNEGDYDLVFSKFLAEHVASGLLFHQNVKTILAEGGYAFHYFPTLYNIPFAVNLAFPEALSEKILLYFQPMRVKEGKKGKFPAHYSWCYGPTKSSIERFLKLGYSIESYTGFFGHDFYQKAKWMFLLAQLENLKKRFLVNYPIPLFTQFSHVLLKNE